MARVTAFEFPVTPEDILDIHMTIDSRKITRFSMNLRCRIKGDWVEVARYDTEHGALHVHRNFLPKKDQVRNLERRHRKDHARALDLAKADLVMNWKRYRAQMEAMLDG